MDIKEIIKNHYIKKTLKARQKSIEKRTDEKKRKQKEVLENYYFQKIKTKKDFIGFCKAEAIKHLTTTRTIQNWLREYNISYKGFID